MLQVWPLTAPMVVRENMSNTMSRYPSGLPQAYWNLAAAKGYCFVGIALWHMFFAYCPLLHPDDRNLKLTDLPFDPRKWILRADAPKPMYRRIKFVEVDPPPPGRPEDYARFLIN